MEPFEGTGADPIARDRPTGRLELLEPPRWVDARGGTVRVEFSLPRQGLSLLRVRW
ncbi:MAG: hypothetical protein NZR01_04705 [Bryobacteraceae bacterium]|nr:hypothetical protein [Bryobacteraceae bacterium]